MLPTFPFSAKDRLASDRGVQAAYVSDALAGHDAALVVLALKEIGALRRIPVVLDEDPTLGEVLRVVRDLELDLEAVTAST